MNRLLSIACLWLVAWGGSAYAASDALDEVVSLRAESDLVRAVAVTLRHAIATSEQFQGRSPQLRRFAERELKARRDHLRAMRKRFGVETGDLRTLAVLPHDDESYARAMLRNHARLLELIEYGQLLELSGDTRRLIDRLAQGARTELAVLDTLGQPARRS